MQKVRKSVSLLLLIFCCILVVKSETCLGTQEKAILSGIKSSIKKLEEKLTEKSPRCRAGWKEFKDHCYFFSIDKKAWKEAEVHGKSPRCRAGWKEFKDHCYFFSTDKKNWQEAELECRNLGGYLTQVTDSAENSWIVSMITSKSKKVNQQNYWMGANDFKEGDWRWVNDLSKVHFTSWQSGQPDNAGGKEDCSHFWHGSNYKWNDQPCNDNFAFICESPLGSNCLPYSRLLKSAVSGK